MVARSQQEHVDLSGRVACLDVRAGGEALIRRSACRLWTRRELPFPAVKSATIDHRRAQDTYHLERVQLLLDLLSKEGRQAIACSNLPSSIVLSRWPGVVELDARAEADVASRKTSRRARQAPRFTVAEVRQGQEVFFSFYID